MLRTRPKDDKYLILFSVGRVQFAAEAHSVRGVAEVGWMPMGESDRLVDMAALLGLPSQKPSRTILVATRQGTIGFAVDMIAKDEISQHAIKPVPALLREWMRPVAVTGFFEYKNQVIGVLDFQRLAEVAIERSPSQEQKESESKP